MIFKIDRNLMKQIFYFICVLIFLICTGCTSVYRIKPLDTSFVTQISHEEFKSTDKVLGIDRGKNYSDESIKALILADIFKEVKFLDELSKEPDLRITSYGLNVLTGLSELLDFAGEGPNITYFLYYLSLGTIPYIVSTENTADFGLKSTTNQNVTNLTIKYKTQTVTGLLVPHLLKISKLWSNVPKW